MSLLQSIPVIGDLITSLTKGLDDLFTSDEERGQIDIEKKREELKKIAMELKAQHMQLQINMAQANHPSIFVAGARPAIIWIGAVGLFYEAILRPILSWISTRFIDLEALMGERAFRYATPDQIEAYLKLYELPSINDELFMPIVLGVLGIGGMRSWEKLKGKARDNLGPGSQDYQQLAETMMTKIRAEQKAMEGLGTGNAAMDEFKQASAQGNFKPYYPSEEKFL